VQSLVDSLSAYLAVLRVLEGNRLYRNLIPKCEVRLGKRGLYRSVGGQTVQPMNEEAMLWVLNYSDGTHSLLEIAEKAGLTFDAVRHAATTLEQHGILEGF